MGYRRNYKVKPDEFRQRVRRFPRDHLLRRIALIAARENTQREASSTTLEERQMSVIREGYLFQIAGLCVRYCNNHRTARVDDQAVGALINGCHNVWPPELDEPRSDGSWHRVLSRVAYLQMPFQLPPLDPLTRTLCLFGDDPRIGRPLFDDVWWDKKLGVALSHFLKIGFGMYAAATIFGGSISREALLSSDFRPLFDPVSPGRGLRAVDAWLARPIGELVELAREHASNADDLWTFNPLYERPIALMDGTYVIPSPLALLQRLGPQGMYFLVIEALDADKHPKGFQRFTSALGVRYQNYIGEQLRLLQHATVHPEITYGSSQRSVDFIVETPEVLVLVEAKSVAPDAQTRSGIFPRDGGFDRINQACNQISRTAKLIKESHPDLPALDGRPVRGLVVTREDHFNLLMPFITDLVKPASVPTTVISSQQLEQILSGLSDDPACGQSLLGALTSDPNQIQPYPGPLPATRNPLLEEIEDRWWAGVSPPTVFPSG